MICGIDEAGRGALAGPMVVAGCVLFDKIDGLMDSKKLSEKKREILYSKITQNSRYLITYFSNKKIDTMGLSACLRLALLCFKRYFNDCEIIFDGNTDYQTKIKTLIKADSKIDEVSAASILAKVSRDRLMNAYDTIYPKYGYKTHKGYGTKAHINAIKLYGLNQLSRNSFKLKQDEKSLFI